MLRTVDEQEAIGLRFQLNQQTLMTPNELAPVLQALGCPPGKSLEMAAQLDKRARQLADQKQRSYDEALRHLLTLMRQGWAAQERGI